MTTGLDFLGIGAQKAGTTSLHEYMRTHPELFLPEAKEQPFFTNDLAYREGWHAFEMVAFRDAPVGALRGKITPHYLAGPVAWNRGTGGDAGEPASLVTARRIAGLFPGAKLIVMLRDPLERAISSYWQAVVLGDEGRGLDDALEAELEPEALARERTAPSDGHQHIVAGEYARHLSSYLECFPREQLSAGSTHVLEADPITLLHELWRFLGVDAAHVPPNLGVRYQERGTEGEAVRSARCQGSCAGRRAFATPGTRCRMGLGRARGRGCGPWPTGSTSAARDATPACTSSRVPPPSSVYARTTPRTSFGSKTLSARYRASRRADRRSALGPTPLRGEWPSARSGPVRGPEARSKRLARPAHSRQYAERRNGPAGTWNARRGARFALRPCARIAAHRIRNGLSLDGRASREAGVAPLLRSDGTRSSGRPTSACSSSA